MKSHDQARFNAMLAKLFERKTFESQCTGRKGGVWHRYARTYMRERATVVVWTDQGACTSRADQGNACICGFGLGYEKREADTDVFYVDLVCTQHRQGRAILRALENHAKTKGLKVVALRAAVPELVKVYERHGYRRVANACLPPSRASRAILRSIGSGSMPAAGVPGASESGVLTDGTRVVTIVDRQKGDSKKSRKERTKEQAMEMTRAVAAAWRMAKRKQPTGTSELPPGWRHEQGNHGWWMTKCLVAGA